MRISGALFALKRMSPIMVRSRYFRCRIFEKFGKPDLLVNPQALRIPSNKA